MVTVGQCPICGNYELRDLYSCKDTIVSQETFHVKQCTTCGLGITTPRPGPEAIDRYYRSEDYISHSGKARGLTGTLYRFARKFTTRWKRTLVEEHALKGSILDVGCGTGEFLKEMQNSQWHITGSEPSADARNKAISLTKGPILAHIQDLNSRQFDAITLWHVLEHVQNLHQTVQTLQTILKPQGVIFIAVPNYCAPEAIRYRQHWAGFDVPRHLWHFTKDSMTKLLKQHQLQIKTILPMKLDAYYISLLSEQNKNSSAATRYIRAFLSGLKSNIKASIDINHSSLIYIAKRA
jgi:2-polyprenyl-3-methyl-5-hydroxy-6-metoxy-1,4-benzoquinol methylase